MSSISEINLGGLDSELYPDGLVENSLRDLAFEWADRNRGKLFYNIVSTHPDIAPVEIEAERIEVNPEETQKIMACLEAERIKRAEKKTPFKIDKAEEEVAWKLLGGRPVKSQKKLEDYFLSNPKEHEKFSETLAKVQSVNGKLLGGIAYTEDPQVLYHLTNVKPEKSNKNTALALGITGLTIGAAVAAYLGIVRPQQEQEERIKPLIDAGDTKEHAISFDNKHRDWAPYNQTVAKFALFDSNYPPLSEYGLSHFKNIRDIPTFVLFGNNQTLLSKIYENILKDSSTMLDKSLSTTSAAKLLNDLNIRSLNRASLNLAGNLTLYNGGNMDIIGVYGKDALWNAFNATEEYPKINSSLNKFGNDWLVWFLADNKGDEKYWPAINAFGQLAQVYFYDMNYSGVFYPTGIPPIGVGVNRKYDPIERTLTNERWSQLKDWNEKGEILIPIDGVEKSPWKDEKKYINNLRGMILPYSLFYQRMDNPGVTTYLFMDEGYLVIGGVETDYGIPHNTTKATEMALYNVRLLPTYHDVNWKRITNPKTFEEDINSLKFEFSLYKDCPTFIEAYPEILQTFLEKGTFYDRTIMAIYGITCREIKKYSPSAREDFEYYFSSLISSVGGAGYVFDIKYPTGSLKGYLHGSPGYPISDDLYGMFCRFNKYGRILMHKDTNAVCPWLFEKTLDGENYMDITYPFVVEDVYNALN